MIMLNKNMPFWLRILIITFTGIARMIKSKK